MSGTSELCLIFTFQFGSEISLPLGMQPVEMYVTAAAEHVCIRFVSKVSHPKRATLFSQFRNIDLEHF